jgi:lipoprotein-releasing system permease protein
MDFSLFLALKYLKPKRSFVSVVTVVSVVGVILGVAILVIVLSVMTGFNDLWTEKILAFSPHILIFPRGYTIHNETEITERVMSVEGVKHAAPFVQTIVLMRNGDNVAPPYVVGIDADYAGLATEIPHHMTNGEFDITGNNVAIGTELAMELGVGVGDTILVYSPKSVLAKDEIHLPEELVVSGIFSLGYEFDCQYAITSIDTARELCGIEEGALAIRVMTQNPHDAPQVARIAKKVDCELGGEYNVRTWMHMNRTLFGALRVEKNIMFVLLFFITIVAMFCIMVTLIVMGVQKTREIGLLRALGFSSPKIMGVFLWYGITQCLGGTIVGIGLGLLVLQFRNHLVKFLTKCTGMEVFPKEIYQFDELPANTTVPDVAAVVLCAVICCIIASIIPAWRAARFDPVRALRHE